MSAAAEHHRPHNPGNKGSKMTYINYTNAPVVIDGQTIKARGWQPIQRPLVGAQHQTDVINIVDPYVALCLWGRNDLAVVSELLASGRDRTAVALADAGLIVAPDGKHAVSPSGKRILMLDQVTITQLLHFQDDAPTCY